MTLSARLAHQDWLLLDGGLATELEARGHDLSDPLWSARLLRDDPGAIEAVHAAYVAAGAECVIGASYQATLENVGAPMLHRAVALARAAATGAGVLVAASVGPYGAARADGSEYSGDYDLDEAGLRAWHAPRLAVLQAASPDVLACETIPSFAEARALATLVATEAWISFSCRDGKHVCDGTPIAECAARLDEVDAVVAVGVNCTAPRFVESLIGEIASATRKPIVVYPNSGERYAAGDGWHGDRDELVALAPRWRAAGARVIGGCCRTGPAEIAALRTALSTS